MIILFTDNYTNIFLITSAYQSPPPPPPPPPPHSFPPPSPCPCPFWFISHLVLRKYSVFINVTFQYSMHDLYTCCDNTACIQKHLARSLPVSVFRACVTYDQKRLCSLRYCCVECVWLNCSSNRAVVIDENFLCNCIIGSFIYMTC